MRGEGGGARAQGERGGAGPNILISILLRGVMQYAWQVIARMLLSPFVPE